MDRIARVRYVDPYFLYTESYEGSKLIPHEAYGYVRNHGKHLTLSFVRQAGLQFSKNMPWGLLIPTGALISKQDAPMPAILKGFAPGLKVEITWSDIVHMQNHHQGKASLMRTTGTVREIGEGRIVLENPDTTRVFPPPAVKHPQKAPRYYVIPWSLAKSAKLV